MDISYLGHSCFKIRGKTASLITDPYSKTVGLPPLKVAAEIVTVSHDHSDHNNTAAVSGTARREEPFVIRFPGEFEISGISVFGTAAYHDNKEGAERGSNTIFSIHVDEISVVHLGDLGHTLSEKQINEIGEVDVLMLPVGGVYTIGPKEAVEVINQLEPSYVLPMHYKTAKHDPKTFSGLVTIDEFFNESGFEGAKTLDKLTVVKGQMPEEMEVIRLEV